MRVSLEEQIEPDSVDVIFQVQGESLFTGADVLSKAPRVRYIIEKLSASGIDSKLLQVRDVLAGSDSYVFVDSSKATYTLAISPLPVAKLPSALKILSAEDEVELEELHWNYSKLEKITRRMRRAALKKALDQAKDDAEVLGVELIGIHELDVSTPSDLGEIEKVLVGVRHRKGRAGGLGISLGHSGPWHLDLVAIFRVDNWE